MADESTTIYRKFGQFDGTNWNSWKFRVGVLLDEKNLSKHIEEDFDDLLEKTIDDEDEMKCIMEEKKCKSILVQCISNGYLEYVQDKKRAKAMYDSLKAVFERKSVASQLYLRKKLITMKFEESGDISHHFLAFDKVVRELKSVGAKLEELDIVCHLLLSLPESYGNLVTALETLEPEKLTIEFVKSRLLDEYNKRGTVDEVAGSGSSRSVAMYSNKQSFTCYRCNKLGHRSFECTNTVANKKEWGNFASKDDESDDNEVRVAFCSVEESKATMKSTQKTKLKSGKKTIKFYLDSCATSHMVNNKKWLLNVKDVKNKKINIAKNGMRLSTEEKGNIDGILMFNNRKRKCVLQDVLHVKDLRYNLLSIGKMEDAGLEVTFKNQTACIRYKGKMLYVAKKCGNLYELELEISYMTNEEHSSKRRPIAKKYGSAHTKKNIKTFMISRRQYDLASSSTGQLNTEENHMNKANRLREPFKQPTVDYAQSKGGGSSCGFEKRP